MLGRFFCFTGIYYGNTMDAKRYLKMLSHPAIVTGRIIII